jgi:gliding motility-associated protein GldL
MGLAVSGDDSANLGDQIVKVSKNLSALNASYELQLQGSNDHLKATSKFYDGLNDLMKNLNDSVDDTKRYKEQIGQLSSNLESLNTIYGNMLTAMRK